MKNKNALIFVTAVVLGFVLTVGMIIPSMTLGYRSFWSPKFQNVERQVFEETKSYNQGMTMDLAKYYGEYTNSDNQENRDAIKSIVRLRFSDYNKNNVNSPELVSFLKTCRGY